MTLWKHRYLCSL